MAISISISPYRKDRISSNSSTMINTWILCTFAFFLTCYLILIYLDWNGFNTIITRASPSADSFSTNFQPAVKQCAVFDDGRWVYDPDRTPAYKEERCPFLSEQVSCQRNGRPDSKYEKWSWEAKGCSFLKFDAAKMLEMMKGKRMVIVGDSISSNQWESLACLLYTALPQTRSQVDDRGSDYKFFASLDHNCSVEFFWSPFLVQLEKDSSNGNRVLRLDKLSNSASKWAGADVMVFSSGHEWLQDGKLKGWDMFEYKGELVEQIEIESAFQAAMSTWAKWIDQNVDSTRTSIYFRSISPGKQECFGSKEPIKKDESFESSFSFPLRMIDIVTETIKEMRVKVRYLNVTEMSGYRIDAHPAVYAHKEDEDSIRELESLPRFRPDCSHWCLPGVPDTWNRLLYASMVFDS
ncbi:Protein trichome birefringence-like 36 [Linum perenne]